MLLTSRRNLRMTFHINMDMVTEEITHINKALIIDSIVRDIGTHF